MRSRTTRIVTVTAALVAAAAVGAGGGAATFAALGSEDGTHHRPQVTAETPQPVASTTESLSVSEVYEKAYKSVVEITSTLSQPTRPMGGEQQAQRPGIRLRLRRRGPHRHERPRRRGRPVGLGHASGTARPTTRPSSAPTRRPTSPSSRSTRPPDVLVPLALGDSGVAHRRRARRRDRQPVRARGDADERHRQRAQPRDDLPEQLHDLQLDPDRRRDQPRQLGRPAPQRRPAR